MLKNIILSLSLSLSTWNNPFFCSPWIEVIQSESELRKVTSLLSLAQDAQLWNLLSKTISLAKRRQRESNCQYFGQLERHLLILLILEILQLFWQNVRLKWLLSWSWRFRACLVKKNGHSSLITQFSSPITHHSNSIFSLTQNKTHLVSIPHHISHLFNQTFCQNCRPHPLTLHSSSLAATRVPFFYTTQWFILSHQKTHLTHLTPIFTKHPSSDPIKTLNSLASTSLTRAHHLKHPKSKSPLPKPKSFLTAMEAT